MPPSRKPSSSSRKNSVAKEPPKQAPITAGPPTNVLENPAAFIQVNDLAREEESVKVARAILSINVRYLAS